MTLRRWVCVALASAVTSCCEPTYASLFDESEKLEGRTVVEAGNMQRLDYPLYGDYNCRTWPTNLYQLGTYCFSIMSYVSAYNAIGLLTVGKTGDIQLFIVEGGLSAKISASFVTMYDCPLL